MLQKVTFYNVKKHLLQHKRPYIVQTRLTVLYATARILFWDLPLHEPQALSIMEQKVPAATGKKGHTYRHNINNPMFIATDTGIKQVPSLLQYS